MPGDGPDAGADAAPRPARCRAGSRPARRSPGPSTRRVAWAARASWRPSPCRRHRARSPPRRSRARRRPRGTTPSRLRSRPRRRRRCHTTRRGPPTCPSRSSHSPSLGVSNTDTLPRPRASRLRERRSERRGDVSQRQVRLHVAVGVLALGQGHVARLQGLVRDLAQQVADDVETTLRLSSVCATNQGAHACRSQRTWRPAPASSRTSGCRTSGPCPRASRPSGDR